MCWDSDNVSNIWYLRWMEFFTFKLQIFTQKAADTESFNFTSQVVSTMLHSKYQSSLLSKTAQLTMINGINGINALVDTRLCNVFSLVRVRTETWWIDSVARTEHLPIFVIPESRHNLHHPSFNPLFESRKIIHVISHHNCGLVAIIRSQLSGYVFEYFVLEGVEPMTLISRSFCTFECVKSRLESFQILFNGCFQNIKHHRGSYFAISSISNCLSKMSMVRTPRCFLSINWRTIHTIHFWVSRTMSLL